MNKILSKVLAVALLGSVTVSTVSAYDKPVWKGTVDGNTTIPQGGDLSGADVNLTLTLGADLNPGMSFDLHFANGGLPNTGNFRICNGTTQVGQFLTANTGASTTIVSDPSFELSSSADKDLLAGGEVLNFIDGGDDNNCSDGHQTIKVLATDCVTIYSDNGKNNNGTKDIPEIDSDKTNPPTIVQYKADIMVSCATPVCTISSDELAFVETSVASGVNRRTGNILTAERNVSTTDYSNCYRDGCSDPVATPESCTTIISINNNTDHNITGLTLVSSFVPANSADSAPVGMTYSYELNASDSNKTAVALGSNVVITDMNLTKGENQEIKVVFTPDGKHKIPQGIVNAIIKNVKDSDNALADAKVATNGIANFGGGVDTKFTVTYMNPNYTTFAKITNISNSSSKLSAVITDTKGHTANATFPDIPAHGTVFVWSKKGDILQKAAAAAGLDNAWSVEFSVSTAVDVAAYMDVRGGQRTLTVLYPRD